MVLALKDSITRNKPQMCNTAEDRLREIGKKLEGIKERRQDRFKRHLKSKEYAEAEREGELMLKLIGDQDSLDYQEVQLVLNRLQKRWAALEAAKRKK